MPWRIHFVEQFMKHAVRSKRCDHRKHRFFRCYRRPSNGYSREELFENGQEICGLTLIGALLTKKFIRSAHCKNVSTLNENKAEKKETRSSWSITSLFTGTTQNNDDHYLVIRMAAHLYRVVLWTTKITIRIVTLSLFFTPLVVLFPVVYLSESFRKCWWTWTLWVVQRSGPTLVKLGQWASTRRDIFSKEFCDQMSVLHNKTTFRQWSLSKQALDNLFGDSRWENFFVTVENDPVGSGCIAQVYRGVIDVYAFEKVTGIEVPFANDRYLDVAIKVAKEGVRESIAIDLSIMESVVRLVQMILPGLSYIDPLSCLNQFREVLKLQVDLRNEAEALKKFGANFDPVKSGVRFPKVLCYSSDVIIETFEEGVYVNKLVTDKHLTEQKELKKKIAFLGARTLLKMIFEDNFIHGDLHPGNILVRFDANQSTKWFSSFRSAVDRLKGALYNLVDISDDIRISSNELFNKEVKEPTLVLLDTGIVIEETSQNLQKLRLLFRAVVDRKGRDVGELLLIHSPKDHCKNRERFCDEVDRIVQIARSKSSLRVLNISEMLNELFIVVRRYEVSLDPSFATVVLAVMVLEGLGRSLDPDLDLFHCARPFLFSMI